jgi:hypothetical protein
MGDGGQQHTLATLNWERELVPILQNAMWSPWPVRTYTEDLAPARIQSLNHPVYSKLSY